MSRGASRRSLAGRLMHSSLSESPSPSPPTNKERVEQGEEPGSSPATGAVLFRGEGEGNGGPVVAQPKPPRTNGGLKGQTVPSGRRGKKQPYRSYLSAVLVILALLAGSWWIFKPLEDTLPAPLQGKRTLVIYNLLEVDIANGENFVYFLREGVVQSPTHAVAILVHSAARHQIELPQLPPGASYEFHDSTCSPWGAYGWLLRTMIGIEKYSYFVFVDSSVRGPFIAPYVKGHVPWTAHLTDRLNETVKLVGGSISCEEIQHWDREGNLQHLNNPHVQRYLFATDQDGMTLLMQTQPDLFSCKHDDTDHAQLPEKQMSRTVLEQGFSMDCLMLRYQGVDWRDNRNWGCNARLDPTQELQYDGTNLSPLEVLFAPASNFHSSVGTHTYHRLAKYTEWKGQLVTSSVPNISTNSWKTNPIPSKAVDMCVMERRGSRCFDHTYYAAVNPELKSLTPIQLWMHFVQFGQFEGRSYRFGCEMDWESLFNDVAAGKQVFAPSPPPPRRDEPLSLLVLPNLIGRAPETTPTVHAPADAPEGPPENNSEDASTETSATTPPPAA